ncbi:unnamed protein product [Rhizophagus irregularis]|nr:unnamed protein product [Rhizophagus irregularis]
MDSTDLFDNQNIREVRRGRKESHVWDHYFKEPLGSGHYTARCHYCNQNWSRGKPEILKSHLALYCKDVPLYIKTEYMEMLAVGTTSTMNRKQKTDSDSLAELTVDRKDKIDQALIRFFICCGIPFSTRLMDGANLQKDIIQTLTEGGGLKTSVKTRWSTAWTCCDSIIRLENNLKNVLETQTEIFINAIAIKNLLRNRQFFQDVEQLHTILAPAKKAIQAVEANSSNMASIFLQLIQMAVEIKKISNYFDPNFKKNCINIFNKRWAQFDTDTYLVAFFLHPRYRDKKFQDSTFRQMALTAMKIWSKFGSDKRSCKILLSQLRSYGDNEPPYDMEYTDEYDTPELWWSTCRQPNNYIQKLALKLFAITPHQAACERAFSVLNWMIGKRRTRLDIDRLQSMAQMHSYYITNAKSELKFSSNDLSENELETALQEITTAIINNDDIFIDDDDIVLDDESIDLNDDDANTNDLIMENIMNLDSFNEQNDDNSNSNISDQQPDESINYEDSNIDFEAIFDEESETD